MKDESAQKRNTPDTLQLNRRVNLEKLLHELEEDGVDSKILVDQFLGLPLGTVALLCKGETMPDKMAREIEWAMNRPGGWLDRDPNDCGI